jgi:adenosylcobinamide-GDP ribazoletransferase
VVLSHLRRWLSALVRLPLAVQGALAFLSRFPVGGGEPAWDAFRETPVAFPLAGYVLGGAVAIPFVFGGSPATIAVLYLIAVYGLTGVTHVDGLADLADAAAVHRDTATEAGDAESTRHAVLKDASTGVGGTLAVVLAVAALALAAFSLTPSAGGFGGVPNIDPTEHVVRAVATVVAAEVGAKAGMGVLASLGTPAHEGLGSQLVTSSQATSLPILALAAAPATLLAGRGGVAVLVAVVLAGPATALVVRRWARQRLGGVSGDVFGAVNELGRIAGLHVGVIAWTLW